MLQETLVRLEASRSFEGRSSLRTWLYKVATNACLDSTDSRRVRGLAKELYPRGDPTRNCPPSKEVTWVEPFPDEYIDGQPNMYPEARYEVRESITLAFVAASAKTPGRQRAALLLCDVLGWDAKEAAEILDTTTAAVNSALQRARETMKQGETKDNALATERTTVGTAGALRQRLGSRRLCRAGRRPAGRRGADHAACAGLVRRACRCANVPRGRSLQNVRSVSCGSSQSASMGRPPSPSIRWMHREPIVPRPCTSSPSKMEPSARSTTS